MGDVAARLGRWFAKDPLSTALIVVRRRTLRNEHELEGFVGREAAFLAANLVLVGMMIVTLIGTMFPVISRVMISQYYDDKEGMQRAQNRVLDFALRALGATPR